MTQPAIEAVGIVKFLGKGASRVQALRGINLSLSCGEGTLLMGPCGSGKTALLTVLGCLQKRPAGTVQFWPFSGSRAAARLAKIRHRRFVFQSYHRFHSRPSTMFTWHWMYAANPRRRRSSRPRTRWLPSGWLTR
jgi:putative ABC transport system ATP-binding protein